MPVIYYSKYIPISDSVREVNEQEHRLGRELLAMALYELYDLRLQPEDISATEKGKPFLPAYPTVHFNISHCDGLVACAVDDSPVGVDAEKTAVFAENDYILLLEFDNGERKRFDVKPYIKGSWFGQLNDSAYFKSVRANGFNVEWPNGQDIWPDDLYYNAV